MRPMCVFSYPSRKVLKSETLSSLSLYTLFFRADNGNEGLDAQFSFSPPTISNKYQNWARSPWKCHQSHYILDSFSPDPDFWASLRLLMSGELSGAASSRTSLSSAPFRLASLSTKNCKIPAPKASPSTLSTVQVRSLKEDKTDGTPF